MTGNLIQPGSFDDCLRLVAPFYAFRGQHCLLDFDMTNAEPANVMVKMLKQPHNKGHQLQWAVCTPSTCNNDDVRDSVLSEFKTAFPNSGNIAATVSHCRTAKETPTFTTADKVAMYFFLFFGLVIFLSTAYDLCTIDAEERAVVLTAFSFYSNGRVLLSPAVDVLPALHGVRVLTRIWDQIGKVYLIDNIGPAVNPEILDEYYSDWAHVFITNPSFAIDSISFLSGCLVGFNFMKERALGIRFNLAHFYFKRYVRFTCPYAAILLLQSTLLIHFDSGPVWLEKMEPLQDKCQDSWYTGLIYLSNYIKADEPCFVQVWFNCVEMQMFWLSPLLLFPLWKSPQFGRALVAAFVVLGVAITFVVAYVNEVPVRNMNQYGKGALVFLPTHTRYPSWIIGLLTGCLLQDAETNPETLTPGQVKLGWLVSMVLIFGPIIGSHNFQHPHSEYNPIVDSLFISVTRPAFTIGLSFVVYACITGHGGPVDTILTWSFFRVTSRVMYSFYLSHTSVLYYFGARSRTPFYINDVKLMVLEIAYFFITWACSMLLCLTFEMPFVIIEQHYLGKTGHPKPVVRGRSQSVMQLVDGATSELPPPATPGASLTNLDRGRTIVWQGSENDMRTVDTSSTDHLLAVVAKRLAKQYGARVSRQDVTASSSSMLQLQQSSSYMLSSASRSRTMMSRARLTSEEVTARRMTEASLRVGTDMEVLEQEDGNLKQLQRARSTVNNARLRARREDHERGTADLDVYQDYDEERELEEEQYFRKHGVELSESERNFALPSRSKSVVRFSEDSVSTSNTSGLWRAQSSRIERASTAELPMLTEEAGPSGVRVRQDERKRVKTDSEVALEKERERKREDEENRMEERRKKEELRIAEEFAKLAEQKRIEEEEKKKEEERKKKADEDKKKEEEEKRKKEEEEERKRRAEDQSGAGPSRPPDGSDRGGNQDGSDPGTNATHWLNALKRL